MAAARANDRNYRREELDGSVRSAGTIAAVAYIPTVTYVPTTNWAEKFKTPSEGSIIDLSKHFDRAVA